MNIQIDSREKARAIRKIVAEFDRQGVDHFVSKLYVGDYMNYDNPRLIIDRKQDLTELCGTSARGITGSAMKFCGPGNMELKSSFCVNTAGGLNAWRM